MDSKQVWFITGASSGFGLHLMKGLLQNGQRVAAVSRDKESLQDFIWPAEIFLPLSVDLSHEESVREAVQQTIRQFGRIDVVVNYAGYDLSAPIDRLSGSKVRQYFEENVFGAFYVLKEVVPYLREQGSGMILNFSSEAVVAAAARSTLYAATKLAIESLIGELTGGIEALGIQQTFIGPGAVLQPQQARQETSFKNNCTGPGEKWALQQRASRAAWA
jgi:NADP-dependent 3-hydroxy acid dehydrogenase YdfG